MSEPPAGVVTFLYFPVVISKSRETPSHRSFLFLTLHMQRSIGTRPLQQRPQAAR